MYGRRVEVTIGKAGEPGRKWTSARGVDSLRITFDVARTDDEEPNQGTVTLTNLAADTRDWLDEHGQVLILGAGYGDTAGQIWTADIARVEHRRQGQEWTTTIEGGDTELAISTAQINRSFSAGTPYAVMASALVDALGVSLGYAPPQFLAARSVRGTTLKGPAVDRLREFAESQGFRLTIQDGVAYVFAEGTGVDRVALLLGPDAGLQTSPSRLRSEQDDGTAARRGRRQQREALPKVEFVAMMDGRLAPARRVQFRGTAHDGVWVVTSCRFEGDSWSGAYGVTCEAVATVAT